MSSQPLSARQRAMIGRIGSYEWTSLSRFNIKPADTTLLSLRKRGLLQVRHTRVLMEPEGYDTWEVRLVATEQLTDSLKAAVQNLLYMMAPVVRKLLAKEIAEVQFHINKEKENVANG